MYILEQFSILSVVKPKSIDVITLANHKAWGFGGGGGGGGSSPFYGLYRYVQPQRYVFFSRFGHKLDIVLAL